MRNCENTKDLFENCLVVSINNNICRSTELNSSFSNEPSVSCTTWDTNTNPSKGYKPSTISYTKTIRENLNLQIYLQQYTCI